MTNNNNNKIELFFREDLKQYEKEIEMSENVVIIQSGIADVIKGEILIIDLDSQED